MIGEFKGASRETEILGKKIETLEIENKKLSQIIKEKNNLVDQMKTNIAALETSDRDSALGDVAEIRVELAALAKQNEAISEQADKYKTACGAQKKYIDGLSQALKTADESREMLKLEVAALQDHRDQIQTQVKAYESLRGAEGHQATANLKYREVLERKNSESEMLVEKYKTSLVNAEQDRNNCGLQLAAKDKLVATFRKQADTMKMLIKQYEADNTKKTTENDSLLEKINRLIKINQDLIDVKQEERDASAPPKILVEVYPLKMYIPELFTVHLQFHLYVKNWAYRNGRFETASYFLKFIILKY